MFKLRNFIILFCLPALITSAAARDAKKLRISPALQSNMVIQQNQAYGMLNFIYQGPEFEYAAYGDHKVQPYFRPETVQNGLETSDGKAPAHFFVAGADRTFYPANAEIQGSSVVLTSSRVAKPVAVRYAFTNFPVTNLQNKDASPALPLRTDSWPENSTGQ